MPKVRSCSFCGRRIEPGTGLMYVTRRGDIYWFCSSKCYKMFSRPRRSKRQPLWIRKAREENII
ncbi:MAG: 50S ribosomal protein L24e [Desulfurococcales archaeon]|nr:50S ribosomal protein L24e [Desulfurococcales archaeon]